MTEQSVRVYLAFTKFYNINVTYHGMLQFCLTFPHISTYHMMLTS